MTGAPSRRLVVRCYRVTRGMIDLRGFCCQQRCLGQSPSFGVRQWIVWRLWCLWCLWCLWTLWHAYCRVCPALCNLSRIVAGAIVDVGRSVRVCIERDRLLSVAVLGDLLEVSVVFVGGGLVNCELGFLRAHALAKGDAMRIVVVRGSIVGRRARWREGPGTLRDFASDDHLDGWSSQVDPMTLKGLDGNSSGGGFCKVVDRVRRTTVERSVEFELQKQQGMSVFYQGAGVGR